MNAAQRDDDVAGEKILVLAIEVNANAGRVPAFEEEPGPTSRGVELLMGVSRSFSNVNPFAIGVGNVTGGM